MLHIIADSVLRSQQSAKAFGAVKAEYAAGAILEILVIGEAGQLSCRLIGKPNTAPRFHPFEGTFSISAGLFFHGGDVFTLFIGLGLDNANRDTIYKKGIVHRPSAGWEFPHRYAGSSHRVKLPYILQNPTSLDQSLIDHFTCFLLWSQNLHLQQKSGIYSIISRILYPCYSFYQVADRSYYVKHTMMFSMAQYAASPQ